jgi:hypothetical protein
MDWAPRVMVGKEPDEMVLKASTFCSKFSWYSYSYLYYDIY